VKKRGKKFRDAVSGLEADKAYILEEAVDMLKLTATAKFDETVELHMRTSADPRHADQLVRGVTMLPHGLGKTVRVLVFANGEAANIAKEAGADYIGDDEIIRNIQDGWVDFDVGLAIPDMMSKIGRLGRVLGRRGLMPNPRTGTMVQPQDLPRAIEEAKKGRVEYRMDRTALIHVPVGKVSFDQEKLMENIATIVDVVVKAKPAKVKGTFIRTAFLTSTMGPSIKLDVNALVSVKVA
jgi:large subunit ribosomal protein L1